MKGCFNKIPNNFGYKQVCEMGCSNTLLDNEHILNCPKIAVKMNNFNDILNGSLKKKIEIVRIYQENQEKRRKYL